MKNIYSHIVISIVLLFSTKAYSQSNTCAGAVVITPSFSACNYESGTSEGATQSLATCSGGGNADDDVWYKFVANSAIMNIKVNPSESYDAVVQLYSGACGGLTSLVCADTYGDNGTETITTTALVVGNTYFVRVYHYDAGSGSDDFSVCIFGVPDVANDIACDAIALPDVTPNCNMQTFTTSGATDSGIPGPGTCGTVGYSGGDVWFSAVVPSNGEIEITTLPGVITDAAMALYDGTCGALTLISCNDDFSASNFMPYIFASGLTPGETVFIRFWDFNNDTPGTFSLCVSSPLNDLCDDASLICNFNGYGGITSSTYGVDKPDNMEGNSLGGPFGTGHAFNDVVIDNNSWIKFIASEPTATFDVDVDFCFNGDGMQMQIFSANNCTNFAAVSNFLQTASSQTVTATGLIPGDTYYIMIDGFDGDVCNYVITAQQGVRVVEITSSAGTSVCPGQPTELSVETSLPAVTYAWEATPGGVFGTGLSNEMVTVTVPTVYTVTVTGFCETAETTSITVTPDKTTTADFDAIDLTTSNVISPFPTTFDCEDDAIGLLAFDSIAAGGYLTPSLSFIVITDNWATTDAMTLEIFEDGTSIYFDALDDNTIHTVYGGYLSPSSNYSFEICETFGDGGASWKVYDNNTGLYLDTGSFSVGPFCETFGNFSPAGNSTWSITPAAAAAALTSTDYGYAEFDPNVSGVGSFDIQFCWDNTVGCSDCETKSVTVGTPHNASWSPPPAVCSNSGLVDLTALIDVSATSTTGTWSGTGVTGDDFDPAGLSGNIAIKYIVGNATCADTVEHNILVNASPVAADASITECETTGSISTFDLTSVESTIDAAGTNTFTWYSNAAITTVIATPSAHQSLGPLAYAVITDGNLCTDTAEVDLFVTAEPSAIQINPDECESSPGLAVFDLTTYNNGVNAGFPNPVFWYEDALATTAVADPTSYSTGTTTVYAVVIDAITSCPDTAEIDLTVLASPTANDVSLSICEDALGSGSAAGVDLTANHAAINGGAGISYAWFTDAALTSPIAAPSSITVFDGDVYYVSVTNNATGCGSVAEANYTVTNTISLTNPNDNLCEDSEGSADVAGVDLTSYQNSIYPGGDTYDWFEDALFSTPVATPTNVTLQDGTYDSFFISITDGNCSNTINITFQINPLPSANDIALELCDEGSAEASFDLSAEDNNVGGANTVNWFSNAGLTIPIATPGAFTTSSTSVFAQVSDVNACTNDAEATLTVLSNPTINMSITDVSCFGLSDGEALANVSSGTSPYSYLWGGGETTNLLVGIANTYLVTVTDSKGCTSVSSATIEEPTLLTLSITATDNLCSGGSSGQITSSPGGGVSSYSFLWSNAATTQNISGLLSGCYTLTLTDQNGCTTIASDCISEPSAMTITDNIVDVLCAGNSSGSIDVSVSGGTPDAITSLYSYSWSNSNTTQDLSSIPAAAYTLTVSDDNGCSEVLSYTITQPASGISLSLSVTDNVSCNAGSDGSISSSLSGGVSPYVYSWSNGSSATGIGGLTAGVYTLTVTDDNLCQDAVQTTITQPSAAVSISAISQDISCTGQSNGEVNTTASGGVSGYTYAWSNGSSSQNLTSLSSGNYTVTLSDFNGCTSVATSVVNEPTELSVSITSQNNVSCFGESDGSLTIEAAGGNSPYSYLWSTGETTSSISGLAAGDYSYTVQDSNGCGLNTLPSDNINTCFEIRRILVDACVPGSIEGEEEMFLFRTGPGVLNTSSLTVTWPFDPWEGVCTNPTFVSNTNASIVSGGFLKEPIGGVIPPNSNVLVVSSTSQTTSSMSFVDLGDTLYVVFQCDDGSANTPGYFGNYNATPGTRTLGVDFGAGCSDQVTYERSSLLNINGTTGGTSTEKDGASVLFDAVGTPTYYNDGCNAPFDTISSASEPIEITQPAALSAVPSSQNPICFGASDGVCGVDVSGGTSPYSYVWSNSATDATISGLASGTYSVTYSDANSCSGTQSFTLTDPAAVSISTTVTEPSCAEASNGEVEISISNGVSVYSYAIEDPLSVLSNGTFVASDTTIDNLVQGVYGITINDGNSCSVISSVTLTASPAMSASVVQVTNVDCFGNSTGEIEVQATGGETPYTFVWSNGQTDDTASALAIGNYEVTITDVNGCTATQDTLVTEPEILNVSVTATDATCENESTGDAFATVSGGTTPYAYFWQNGSTTDSVNSLSGGSQGLVVTDNNGCVFSASVMINTITLPVANNASFEECENPVGTLSAVVNLTTYETIVNNSGGVTFSWLDNLGAPISASQTVATSEDFLVAVFDGTCRDTAEILVSINPAPIITSGGGGDVCTNGAEIIVPISFTFDGVSPFSFVYYFGDDSTLISSYSAAIFSTTATTEQGGYHYIKNFVDAEGCVSESQDSVLVNLVGPTAAFSPNPDNGDPPLTVFFSNQSTNTGSETYTWSFGNNKFSDEVNPEYTYLVAGDYTVSLVVEDLMGCTDSASYEFISVSSTSTLIVPNVLTPNNDGSNDVFAVYGINIEEISGAIYNRWGEKLFQLDRIGMGWDGRTFAGKEAPEGTYFYYIVARGLDGKEYDERGTVFLNR